MRPKPLLLLLLLLLLIFLSMASSARVVVVKPSARVQVTWGGDGCGGGRFGGDGRNAERRWFESSLGSMNKDEFALPYDETCGT